MLRYDVNVDLDALDIPRWDSPGQYTRRLFTRGFTRRVCYGRSEEGMPMASSSALVEINGIPGESPRLAYESQIAPLTKMEAKKVTSEWPKTFPMESR